MRWTRHIGLLLLLVTFITACARPLTPPSSTSTSGETVSVPPASGPSSPVEEVPPTPQTEEKPKQPPASAPPPVEKREPAKVLVDQRYGDGWKRITPLTSHATAGPTEIRLVFSKPVRRQEVERALTEAQAGPVRGLMQWQDDRTLYWQIAELPPRLDFLLNGAHDQEGVPLSGGIPSLRVGGPPLLVEINLAEPVDLVRAELPPDIVSAALTPDGLHMNLLAWKPGATRWDWQTVDYFYTLSDRTLKPGHMVGAQPRVPGDLENWVESPNGTAIAGLRTEQRTPPSKEPYRADLIIMDLRGGRRKAFENFISRYMGNTHIDPTTHLAWSANGTQVAALSFTDPEFKTADLVGLNVTTGARTVLAKAVPVPSWGARLAWASSGQFILAGNVLVDLQTQTTLALEGNPLEGRGIWEPGGSRLLYGAQDWGAVFVVDAATGEVKPLGTGLIVGWTAPGKVYMIRWPASATRYHPPGM